MIRNTISVQWNISTVLQLQKMSTHMYLGVHLTYFCSDALKRGSELYLCYFQ